MSTFTAQELADFYQQVADGGEMELEGGYGIGRVTNLNGPNMYSLTNKWRIKPKKKVVDMSVLIKSGIDCTFWDDEEEYSETRKLSHILYGSTYVDHQDTIWEAVRPRRNHVHAWQGDECPLPEGVTVRVWEQIGANIIVKERTTTSANWPKIVWFEVLGLEDGYCWPFEE